MIGAMPCGIGSRIPAATIESTSRLLRKLELPQLKVEEKKDEELRVQSDQDKGGGYDPYNQSTKRGGAPPRKGR